jgi:hypothetical protein
MSVITFKIRFHDRDRDWVMADDWEVSLSSLTTIRELMAFIDKERGIPVRMVPRLDGVACRLFIVHC